MTWQDGQWWLAHVSQGYHWSSKNTSAHSGEDFAMPTGTPIESPNPGTIRDAQWEPWGYQVDEVTDLPGYGLVTESYLHLSSLAVHAGDVVLPGQKIGDSGTPPDPKYGNGPHLHFELTSGANSPYIDYSPHTPTSTQYPEDPGPLVNTLRAAQGGVLGGVTSNLDPTAWVAAIKSGIAGVFNPMGVDSLADFFWRSGLISAGLILVIYALFKLFEPATKTAVNVALGAAKAAA